MFYRITKNLYQAFSWTQIKWKSLVFLSKPFWFNITCFSLPCNFSYFHEKCFLRHQNHKYLIGVDCSWGQLKRAELKTKVHQVFTQHCKIGERIFTNARHHLPTAKLPLETQVLLSFTAYKTTSWWSILAGLWDNNNPRVYYKSGLAKPQNFIDLERSKNWGWIRAPKQEFRNDFTWKLKLLSFLFSWFVDLEGMINTYPKGLHINVNRH